ncbi:MAG TPA: N-acetylneuraminate synthase family protein [Ignavibacteria bacterium]|nr:N-acetylneuraminate synthase family protein [Ignavibacteria bacterium]
MVYNILEVANTHGGNFDYVISLIKEFSEFQNGFGMKFQPLKYDKIALSDYEWYPVYEKLFFDNSQWKKIIAEAKKTKDIWLDIFDDYSVEILKENLKNINGIKLQASVLYNVNLLNQLSEIDLSKVKLILNIAAYDLDEIKKIIKTYSDKLNPAEIILQIGFQAYPTKLEDSGLSKIKTLKNNFENKICFADHIDGKGEDAKMLPVFAVAAGADYVEKHIMHSSLKTEYDFYSSLTIEQYKDYINLIDKYYPLLETDFVNDSEREYLRKSIQMPVVNTDKEKGRLLSDFEFDFKRSNQQGLNIDEIKKLQSSFHILAKDIRKNTTVKSGDYKKAKIAAIIACRMKSSRLPKKAILKIGDVSSIELCIKNTLKFKNVDNVVLATSTLEEDSILGDYKYREDVIFHKGDPDDVIQRYIDICDKLGTDVVVRITGDMQYVSDDICQILLKEHFAYGADYTSANKAAIGTNLEIINVAALREVKKYFKSANYSEYMTWYFRNNPEYFKLHFIDLPDELVRDYRLTLDYPEDLDMFNIIEKYFKDEKLEFSLPELYKFLDSNPEIANINKNGVVKYQTDKNLIDTLNKLTKIHKEN